jgi:hypothetical protein
VKSTNELKKASRHANPGMKSRESTEEDKFAAEEL